MEKADKFLASSLKREITYVLLILSKIENGDTLEEIKDSPMSHVSKKMEKIRYYYKLL
jgi:hypothetical protein